MCVCVYVYAYTARSKKIDSPLRPRRVVAGDKKRKYNLDVYTVLCAEEIFFLGFIAREVSHESFFYPCVRLLRFAVNITK